MNRKLMLVLALLILAAVSVSIAAAGDDSGDIISADDSDDVVKEDISADGDKISESNDIVVGAYNGFTIKVVWDDSNDAKGKRPDSVLLKVEIKSNSQDITIKSSDKWNTTVKESVDDGDVNITPPNVSGYTAKVSGNEKDGFTVTLTLDDSNSTSSGDDNNKKGDTSDDKSTDDKTSDKKTPVKKTSVKKTTTTTTTTKVVKKEPKKTNETNKTKDKNNTGNPILLGVLALSAAGLVLALRRRE